MYKCCFLLIVLLCQFSATVARNRTTTPRPPPLECYQCNSDDLPACATTPTEGLPSGKCKHFREQCVTTIIDSVTFRGCQGSITIPIDIELFTYCNSSLCNNEIYPPGRRKCYQCGGSKCIENFQDTLKPCVNYEEGDFCISDVIDETDIIRGCFSDPDYSPGPFVQICDTNGCNDHPIAREIECVTCSSEEGDKNCAIDPAGSAKDCGILIKNTCKVQTLLGRSNDTCFTYHKYDKVVRGCTRYGGKLQLDEKFFKTCEGKNCNDRCITDRKCLVCDSSKHPNCATKTEEFIPQNCPRHSYCHSCESGGTVIRGCGKPNDLLSGCYQCQDSDGCNKKNFLKCYTCSSEYDPNCAQWTLANSNKINVEVCSNPDDSCIVGIRSDGHTIRGCSSDIRPCSKYKKCAHCNESLCNGGIFPKDRQQCYHCQDSTKCRENLEDIEAIPCEKYTSHDGCFQYVNENYEMVRGCRSDKTFPFCKAIGDKCWTCSGPGCNDRLASRASEILCISCNDENKSCPWSQKPETAIKCTQQIPYYLNETCFSRMDKKGVASRGCSMEKDACTKDYSTCITCQFDGCNIPKMHSESCIQCQSNLANETTCDSTAEGITPKLCNADVQYYEDRGCYVREEDKVIKRGCVVDLPENDRMICKGKNPLCYYCDEKNCNKIDATNNSVCYLGASTELFLLPCLFTVRWMV